MWGMSYLNRDGEGQRDDLRVGAPKFVPDQSYYTMMTGRKRQNRIGRMRWVCIGQSRLEHVPLSY
jgi:hypothetical protein